MTARPFRAALLPLLLLSLPAAPRAGAPDIPPALAIGMVQSAEVDRTLARAGALLPRRPRHLVVIDVSRLDPNLQRVLEPLDAFIAAGGPRIYLTGHSAVLAGAMKGSRFHLYVLASIIWHEMAHLDGADEAQARRAEEQLWSRFIQDGLVDRVTALRYLNLLAQRAHDAASR